MPVEVKLPRLGQGMESGTIIRWLKAEGEEVRKGEPLYELDTDKVTQEVEADASGVLLKIAVPEGEVEVGRTIAYIGEPGEEVSSAQAQPAAEPPQAEAPPPTATEERPQPKAAAPPGDGRVKASPLARRIARERGIDLSRVRGTGPEGRIVAADLEAAPAAAPAAPGAVEEVPLSPTRKTIARRLTEAWEAPVFQLGVGADMTRVLALRELLVADLREGETKPTVNDVLVRVVAAALVRHREVNAHFAGDRILRFPAAHVGIAVAAPNGLVVPVIRDADRRTVKEIAAVRADLVARARDGKLTRADLDGGTFTISNLGMYGVETFTAVLNPPQAAILAVGAVQDEPAVRAGELVVRPTVHLTLTCDHRAIDGADGAEFLRTVKAFLEEPALAL